MNQFSSKTCPIHSMFEVDMGFIGVYFHLRVSPCLLLHAYAVNLHSVLGRRVSSENPASICLPPCVDEIYSKSPFD